MFKYYHLIFALLFFIYSSGYSQCDEPVSIGNLSITHANCPSNGKIVVGTVLPNVVSPVFYQYAILNVNDLTAPLNWQNSNEFNSLLPGTYRVFVRKVCSGGFSTAKTIDGTVNNTQQPLQFAATPVNLRRPDLGCSNGSFVVNAINTTPQAVLNTYQYALVSSATEPVPAVNYVVPPQSSNVFENLPAGTYYPRIINACGNAITTTYQLQSATFVNSNKFSAVVKLHPYGCDSLAVSFGGLTNFLKINNTIDTALVRLYIVWPSGNVDTLPVPNTSTSGITGSGSTTVKYISYQNIDPNYNPNNRLFDKISTWPLNVQLVYKDQCGRLFDTTFSIPKPTNASLTFEIDESHSGSNCDTQMSLFRIRYLDGSNHIGNHLATANYGYIYIIL